MTRPLDRRSFILLTAGAALGAACGGGGGDDDAESSTTSAADRTSTTPTTAPPVFPLTGLPATGDPALVTRPALVVKIDNADGSGDTARPQAGLEGADVVFEEMVEGSVTRFASVFHSAGSDPVGPIRSGRDTDVEIFSALNRPLFGWSGGNDRVTEVIRSSPIIDVGYDVVPDSYYRRDDRRSPHNLYSSTDTLRANAPDPGAPPNPLFTYLGAGEPLPATAIPATHTNVVFGTGPGSAPADWNWDPTGAAWLRTQKGEPHVVESGAQIAAQNVIIQFVEYFPNGDVDVAGNPVFQATLVAGGEAWVLTQGTLNMGTWSKTSATEITTYTDAAGVPIKLTPGKTWVELCPVGGAIVE